MKFNARFNLRKQASKEPEIIYLISRLNGFKFVYNSGFKVVPKYWDIHGEKIRNVNAVPNRDFINDYLTKLRAETKNLYELALLNREPITKDYLKNGLDLWTGRKRPEIITLFNWIAEYIAKSPERINPRTGRTISHRTIQEYNTTQKYIVEFAKTLDYNLDFDTVEIETLDDFRDYLTTVKGFAVNNIAKHLNNFRQFLRAANGKKVRIDPVLIDPNGYKIAKETPQDIYLNESELNALFDFDLSDINRSMTLPQNDKSRRAENVGFATLDKVRDLFLIGCWTGLRVSDFSDLKPHHFKGEFIDIYQYKTGEKVVIPIFDPVQKILSKYDGHTPPRIAPSKINRCIKAICKAAGIVECIEKQRTTAGKKQSTIYEKWQLVSSHTARRSFATNMVKRGYPTRHIMAITGHKKEAVFLKYVKLTEREHAEILRQQIAAPETLT